MIRFFFYLFLLLVMLAAGFSIYAIFVPPEAPNAPMEVEIELDPNG